MAALRLTIPLMLSLCAAGLAACAARRADPAPLGDGSTAEIVITEADIAESGARTAWDVIRRHASHLTTERRDGSPGRLQRHGRSSIYLDDAPLVFLDGVQMADFRNLQYIPARDIQSIRIMSGITATTYYGTNAASGVILVQTKAS